MLKKKYMIIGFLAFCLTATLFIGTTTSPATTSTAEYDPWVDINDDGIIDIYDIVKLGIRYGTTGTPINKTAILLELLDRVSTIEEKLNQTKTIRFFEPNETTNDQTTAKDGAVFVWAPNNSTNNAILEIHFYFQYRVESVGYKYRIVINNAVSNWRIWDYPAPTYVWLSVLSGDNFRTLFGGPWISPNQDNYTIKFQFATLNHTYPAYVKNINIILTVADGIPASN